MTLTIDGVLKTYGTDYLIDGQEVSIFAAPPLGSTVVIQRKTDSERLVSWVDASVLGANDLNTFEVQLLHLSEEEVDRSIAGDQYLQEQLDIFVNPLEFLEELEDIKEAVEGARDTVDEAVLASVEASGEAAQSADAASNSALLAGIAANAANLSAQASHDIAFTAKLLMDADLAHAENTTALVTNDPTSTNNGIYIKLGASGSGSWQKSAYVPPVVDWSVSANKITPKAISMYKFDDVLRGELLDYAMIKSEDLTPIGATVVMHEDATVTSTVTTGTNGAVFLPSHIKEVEFVVQRSSFLFLGGDSTNWLGVGLKSPFLGALYTYNSSGSVLAGAAFTDQSPTAIVGDTIKVVSNGLSYVFTIKRVGQSAFVDWFTITKATYPDVTLWTTNERFGFLLSTAFGTNITVSAIKTLRSKTQMFMSEVSDLVDKLTGDYLITINDLTTINATLTLDDDNYLDGEMLGDAAFGATYMPVGSRQMQFTVNRGSLVILGGYSLGWLAVGIKSAFWQGIYQYASTSSAVTTIAAPATDQSGGAVTGDTIKVVSNGLSYVFTIKRVGESTFVDWFTIIKNTYPDVTLWSTNERLGFVLSAPLFDGVYVAKDIIATTILSNLDTYLDKFNKMSTDKLNKFTKWNALGDSMTAPGIYQVTIDSLLGTTVVRNYGIAGTLISKLDDSDTTSMSVRCGTMDADADLITVFGGVNDFIGSYGGGNLGTITSTDEKTFYGALKAMAARLITRYPTATIVFMTPIKVSGYTSSVTGITWYSDTVNQFGYKLIDYVKAMKEIGEIYSIPVLDLYGISGISSVNVDSFLADKLHPNNAGYARIGKIMGNFINSLA